MERRSLDDLANDFKHDDVDLKLYEDLLYDLHIPEWFSKKIVATERKIRDKDYNRKLITTGYFLGFMPGEFQRLAGRVAKINEDDYYKLTMWHNVPSIFEIAAAVTGAAVYLTTGDLPDWTNIAVDAALLNKAVMLTVPYITKKPWLHPLSAVNLVTGAPIVGWYALKVRSWYKNRSDKQTLDLPQNGKLIEKIASYKPEAHD